MLDFFKENTKLSFTRLAAAVVIVTACVLSIICVILGTSNESLILGMLAIGFGAKVYQKGKENANNTKSTPPD